MLTYSLYDIYREQQLSIFRMSEGNITNSFVVEHFPWKGLSEDVFKPIGGKATAKELRHAKLNGTIPQIKQIPTSQATATTEEIRATMPYDESEDTKKRKIDVTDSSVAEEITTPQIKRARSSSTDKSNIENLSEIIDDMYKSAPDDYNAFTTPSLFPSAVTNNANAIINVEIPDVSGRGIIPTWKRVTENGMQDISIHSHYDNKPIQVTWTLLDN